MSARLAPPEHQRTVRGKRPPLSDVCPNHVLAFCPVGGWTMTHGALRRARPRGRRGEATIMGTDWTLWLMAGTAGAWLGGFGWVVARRYCARLRNGFAVEITAALVTAGAVTALSLGGWAYHQSRQIVFGQLVETLDNVGRTAEQELNGDVRRNMARLSNLAVPELVETARKQPERARERLS